MRVVIVWPTVFSAPTSSFDEEFPRRFNSEANELNIALWVSRILGWDGLLPIAILLVSIGVAVLFPNNEGIQLLTLLVLPIAAFFWRARAGRRQISTNACGTWVRAGQYVALGFALLLFLFFDFMLTLLEFIPKAQRQMPAEDVPIWAGMVVAYVILVTFAMFPGRSVTTSER